jgi:hypothetical protein
VSADGTEILSGAALASRLMALFLSEAATQVRNHCDEVDADLLEIAARDCADTVEYEFDMLQMATRAIGRSTTHAGWAALCEASACSSEAYEALEEAIALYADVAKAAWVEFSHAPMDTADGELERLKAVAHAHDGRVAQLTRVRDLWFEPEGTEAVA